MELARQETGPVILAIRTTVRTAAGKTDEILHSVIAFRTPTGRVQFADYGGKWARSLRELVGKLGTPVSEIELYQSGLSAAVIDPARLTGEWALKLAKGSVVVMEGLAAIETVENGVEMAVPAAVVASSAPMLAAPLPSQVVKGRFDAYKSRAQQTSDTLAGSRHHGGPQGGSASRIPDRRAVPAERARVRRRSGGWHHVPAHPQGGAGLSARLSPSDGGWHTRPETQARL